MGIHVWVRGGYEASDSRTWPRSRTRTRFKCTYSIPVCSLLLTPIWVIVGADSRWVCLVRVELPSLRVRVRSLKSLNPLPRSHVCPLCHSLNNLRRLNLISDLASFLMCLKSYKWTFLSLVLCLKCLCMLNSWKKSFSKRTKLNSTRP